MTNEFSPSKDAIDDFVSWLDCVLKDTDHLYDWADHLIINHDWSASNRIEVPGRQTLSGNPEIYTF